MASGIGGSGAAAGGNKRLLRIGHTAPPPQSRQRQIVVGGNCNELAAANGRLDGLQIAEKMQAHEPPRMCACTQARYLLPGRRRGSGKGRGNTCGGHTGGGDGRHAFRAGGGVGLHARKVRWPLETHNRNIAASGLPHTAPCRPHAPTREQPVCHRVGQRVETRKLPTRLELAPHACVRDAACASRMASGVRAGGLPHTAQ